MFRRIVFENPAALFTLVAFFTAASIYVVFAWRALRMKRPQIAHLENLPFATATPVAAGATDAGDWSGDVPVAVTSPATGTTPLQGPETALRPSRSAS